MVRQRALTHGLLLAIVAVAVAVRLLHYAALADTAFPRIPLIDTESDMQAFWSWAQSIVAGDWLGRDTYHPQFAWMREIAPPEVWYRWWGGKAIFHQAPLYPYFVALILAVGGAKTPGPVLLVQLLLGALQPLVLYGLGRRIGDERSGLIAAGIGAVYAPLVFHEGVLLRDWLPPILEPLALLLLLRAAERGHPRNWILAGGALGLALLTRETALLLLPAVAVWLCATRWSHWREIAVSAAFLAAGFAVVIAPLALRNAAVGAPLLAVSNRGGVTFVQHNAAASSALWSELAPELQQQILEQADGDGRAIVVATLRTYDGVGALLSKLAMKLRGVVDPIEIPNNVSFSYGCELSWVLRGLPTYGWVFPLGVTGLVLSLRDWKRHLLVHLYLAVALASLIISLPLARYRLTIATILILYAGVAVIQLIDAARQRRGRALAWGLFSVASAAALQQWVIAVPELRRAGAVAMYGGGVEYRAAAFLYAADRRFDRAAAELERLQRRVNADPWTAEVARDAAQLEVDARSEWVGQLIARYELDAARRELARADALYEESRDSARGERADTSYNLGVLHHQLGDTVKVRSLLTRYLELAPAGPHADSARQLLAESPPEPGAH